MKPVTRRSCRIWTSASQRKATGCRICCGRSLSARLFPKSPNPVPPRRPRRRPPKQQPPRRPRLQWPRKHPRELTDRQEIDSEEIAPPRKPWRRRVLRGMLNGGAVTLALPLLNCFLNENGTAMASGAPLPLRFGTWFWGLGMNAKVFVPKTVGANYDLPEELSALAPVYASTSTSTRTSTPCAIRRRTSATTRDGSSCAPARRRLAAEDRPGETIDVTIVARHRPHHALPDGDGDRERGRAHQLQLRERQFDQCGGAFAAQFLQAVVRARLSGPERQRASRRTRASWCARACCRACSTRPRSCPRPSGPRTGRGSTSISPTCATSSASSTSSSPSPSRSPPAIPSTRRRKIRGQRRCRRWSPSATGC